MNDFLRPRPSKATSERPVWKERWFLPAVVGAAGLILGMSIGVTNPKTVEVTKEVPGPERTVQVPGPERIVTKEVVPASCSKYMDLSEQAFSLAGEAMGYMSDGMKAAAIFDVNGIQSANSNLKTVTPKMSALSTPSNQAKADCRAAAAK